jgi:hypothetical protein
VEVEVIVCNVNSNADDALSETLSVSGIIPMPSQNAMLKSNAVKNKRRHHFRPIIIHHLS